MVSAKMTAFGCSHGHWIVELMHFSVNRQRGFGDDVVRVFSGRTFQQSCQSCCSMQLWLEPGLVVLMDLLDKCNCCLEVEMERPIGVLLDWFCH